MKYILSSILFILCFNILGGNIQSYLIPQPQIFIESDQNSKISPEQAQNLTKLIKKLETIEFTGEMKILSNHFGINSFKFTLDTTKLSNQEYVLKISNKEIIVVGHDFDALHYAKLSIKQLLEFSVSENLSVPCLSIRDFPNFERRGFMLDISRDKVPTMETLYQIVDYLASWKINEFQLYTEHTFAYKNHKTVWEEYSPMTAEEIQELDEYCKKRYIDLVPNQNSFGHMENWLEHDEYLELAECPTTCQTIWGPSKRHSLDPTNPKSLDLMQELYAELLPNFSSDYFNIGCDETVELGLGRSSDTCRQKGKGRVYLEYLIALNNEANKLGKQTQFWGDIIVNHPELISEIPQNMIPMVWGYDKNFPAGKNLPKFKDAGLDYYVCPGTSSWNSLIGRNHNGFKNLRKAAQMGKQYDAKGYLNTCWGDYGHWQPLSVSLPTIMLGSAYSWNCTGESLTNLEFQLNHYIFKDTTENTAKAILKLGNAYLKNNIPNGNGNAFHLMLFRYKWTIDGHYQTRDLNTEGLFAAEAEINEALEILENAYPQCEDAEIVIKEIKQAANLAKHGINLGVARLIAKDKATENIPDNVKTELAEELRPLIKKHKELWIVRNREGGLHDSAGKLEKLLDYYFK